MGSRDDMMLLLMMMSIGFGVEVATPLLLNDTCAHMANVSAERTAVPYRRSNMAFLSWWFLVENELELTRP
jgi:hypothetical protein